ncbi:MAG: hypothetical protein WCX73_02015 [Candidatus Pacearchaeota archaeon]|jgi:ribosomal protein L24E
MPTCSFCKKNYKEPRGLTVFTFEGKTIHLCSSKCRRNLALKRDPRKVNWIKRDKGNNLDFNKENSEKKVEGSKEKAEKN